MIGLYFNETIYWVADLAVFHHVTKCLSEVLGIGDLGLIFGDYLYPLLLCCFALGSGLGEPESYQPQAPQLFDPPPQN